MNFTKKFIVLGIDCLDYNLVRKWKLEHYMLDNFGYHFVGLDLYTPVIWGKFLTGIDITKYGFNSKRLSTIKRIKTLSYISYPMILFKKVFDRLSWNNDKAVGGLNTTTPIDMKKIASKIIMSNDYSELSLKEKIMLKMLMNAAYSERLPRDLLKKSFIYKAISKDLKVLLIEFPPINDNLYSLIRNTLYFFIGAPPEERQPFLNYVWSITEATLNILLRNLDNYDIIFWYTPVIDIASHMFYRPKKVSYMSRLYAIYKELGKKIYDVVSKLDDESIILIVSDHGYNPFKQDHSHFGYWSTNCKSLGKPIKVLDFAPRIEKLLDKLSH